MAKTSRRKLAIESLTRQTRQVAFFVLMQELSKRHNIRRAYFFPDLGSPELIKYRLARDKRLSQALQMGLLCVAERLHAVTSSRYLYRGPSRQLRARRNPLFEYYFHMDDNWFKQMARMSKPCFFQLSAAIENDPVFANNSRNPQAPVEYQLLMTLKRMGMGGNGVSVGQMARDFAIAEGTVELWCLRCIAAITNNLTHLLAWPDTRERRKIAAEVGRRSPFADCVGFVDGTQIPLEYRPGLRDSVDFWHYKGFYSLALMACCDQKKRFRYALLGFPGSAHDARVFGYTQLVLNPQRFFSRGQWIIGDSAFQLTDNVVTPFKRVRGNANLAADKHRFNQKLSAVRVIIEHAFGMLKMRWQSLRALRSQIDTQIDLNRALNWVRAALILHNFVTDNPDDDFWEGQDMNRLLATFEQEAAAVRAEWEEFIGLEAGEEEGEAPRGQDDRRRRFVKHSAEQRGYEFAYLDESDDDV